MIKLNFKFLPLLVFVTFPLFATDLEELGWSKDVDDFEGTVNYTIDAKPWAYGCDTSTLTGTYGLVSGEPKRKTPLTLAFYFYSVEDLRSEGELKWKTDSGTESKNFSCQNDYDDGWLRQCFVIGLDNSQAKSLSKTPFIRIDFPSKNIDLKSGGSNDCQSMYQSIIRITSDYAKASN